MKIFLAVDGSCFSLAAADAVASRPWPPGTIVRIVYVNESGGESVDVNPARIQPPFPPVPYGIEKALGRFEGHPIKVEARILHGRPKTAILDEARDWGADLIVVGSHGMSGIERSRQKPVQYRDPGYRRRCLPSGADSVEHRA